MNDLEAAIERTALALARKERLIDDEGVVWCRECNSRPALLPSLMCPPCLGAVYSRQHITAPQCVNRAQLPAERKASNA